MIKIVSWNVFLLPKIQFSKIEKRVEGIAQAIMEMDADIICLQEVFEPKAYQYLVKNLKEKYPFYTEKPHRSWNKYANSGLVVFSKSPFQERNFIIHPILIHLDGFSSKGLSLIQFDHFYLINTHFQARTSWVYQKIRSTQLNTLKKTLVNYPEAIVCGDLNINKYTKEYEQLKVLMKDASHIDAIEDKGTFLEADTCFLDYSFVGLNSRILRQESFEIMSNFEPKRLSDHLPIVSTYSFNKA